jgi:hypothetical protein
MIVDVIVGAVLGVFNSVMALLPSFTMLSTPGTIAMVSSTVNEFAPVQETVAAILILIALRSWLMFSHWIKWLWDQIPFKAR